jgi:hypothetical protein
MDMNRPARLCARLPKALAAVITGAALPAELRERKFSALLSALDDEATHLGRFAAVDIGHELSQLASVQEPRGQMLDGLAVELQGEKEGLADSYRPLGSRLATAVTIGRRRAARGDRWKLAAILISIERVARHATQAAAARRAGNPALLRFGLLADGAADDFTLELLQHAYAQNNRLATARTELATHLAALAGAEWSRINSAAHAFTAGLVALAQLRAREEMDTVLYRVSFVGQQATSESPAEYAELLGWTDLLERTYQPFEGVAYRVDVGHDVARPLRTLLWL